MLPISSQAVDLLSPASLLPMVTIDAGSVDSSQHLESFSLQLADALLEAGIEVLEILMRSPSALQAMSVLAKRRPELKVGAGTVNTAEALQAAQQQGAVFAISPGWSRSLLAAAEQFAMPWVPGVATPSEVMAASDAGIGLCKCFPVSQLGGVAYLQSLQGPFPDMLFCATGGIGLQQIADYLALKNVVCVGSSQLLPNHLLAAEDRAALRAHLISVV